jgi:hypothetical protein
MDRFGKLKRIDDLKAFWPHEAHDFTPWLAENLALLAKALELDELSLESTEQPIGPYFVDILAKDIDDNNVIIENQLKKTNHDHLGKALTYAAGLRAKTIIWVAQKFTKEHLQTFFWLNENTREDISFFAVEIELLQIDDSRPAPQFNVVASPTIKREDGKLSDSRQKQLRFWTDVSSKLIDEKIVDATREPMPSNSFKVTLNRRGFVLFNSANTVQKTIDVRLLIRNGKGQGVRPFNELKKNKEAIEKELGEELNWDVSSQDNIRLFVVLRRQFDFNDTDREHWNEGISWMIKWIDKFKTVFVPLLDRLPASALNESGDCDSEDE